MIIHIDRTKKKVLIKQDPKTKSPKAYVVIDYPQDGVTINPGHYSIRLGAAGGSDIELSIDGGDWQKTRENCGYYWYDWHNFSAGSHKIIARMKGSDGKVKKSKAVDCKSR